MHSYACAPLCPQYIKVLTIIYVLSKVANVIERLSVPKPEKYYLGDIDSWQHRSALTFLKLAFNDATNWLTSDKVRAVASTIVHDS